MMDWLGSVRQGGKKRHTDVLRIVDVLFVAEVVELVDADRHLHP